MDQSVSTIRIILSLPKLNRVFLLTKAIHPKNLITSFLSIHPAHTCANRQTRNALVRLHISDDKTTVKAVIPGAWGVRTVDP